MADARSVVSLRLPEELLAWATEYAKERGVSRTALLESALTSFREDCERGMPELRAAAKRQSTGRGDPGGGVGDCPGRPGELGHVWKSFKDDPDRGCEFCDQKGRDNPVDAPDGGGYLGGATTERTALFARLRTPESIKAPKPKGRP